MRLASGMPLSPSCRGAVTADTRKVDFGAIYSPHIDLWRPRDVWGEVCHPPLSNLYGFGDNLRPLGRSCGGVRALERERISRSLGTSLLSVRSNPDIPFAMLFEFAANPVGDRSKNAIIHTNPELAALPFLADLGQNVKNGRTSRLRIWLLNQIFD